MARIVFKKTKDGNVISTEGTNLLKYYVIHTNMMKRNTLKTNVWKCMSCRRLFGAYTDCLVTTFFVTMDDSKNLTLFVRLGRKQFTIDFDDELVLYTDYCSAAENIDDGMLSELKDIDGTYTFGKVIDEQQEKPIINSSHYCL